MMTAETARRLKVRLMAFGGELDLIKLSLTSNAPPPAALKCARSLVVDETMRSGVLEMMLALAFVDIAKAAPAAVAYAPQLPKLCLQAPVSWDSDSRLLGSMAEFP